MKFSDWMMSLLYAVMSLYAWRFEGHAFSGVAAWLALVHIPTRTTKPLHQQLKEPLEWIDKNDDKWKKRTGRGLLLLSVVCLAVMVWLVFFVHFGDPGGFIFEFVLEFIKGLAIGLLVSAMLLSLKVGLILLRGESLYQSVKKG